MLPRPLRLWRLVVALSIGHFCLALAPLARAANDLILRIEGTGSAIGIPGESTLTNHTGEIDCLAFTWGVSRSASTSVANASNFTITKRVDKASPLLMIAVFQGTHFPKAKFFVRSQTASPYDFFVVELVNVALISFQTSGAADGSMIETLSMSFDSIKFTYQQLNPDGTTSGGPVLGGFNVTTNQKI